MEMRARIEALDERCKPPVRQFNREWAISASYAPNLADEVHVCVAGYWFLEY